MTLTRPTGNIWQYAFNGCNLPAAVVELWGSPKQNKSQISQPLEPVQIHSRRWSCANRHSDEPGQTGDEGLARLNRTELNRTDSPSRAEPNRIQTHRTHRARRAHRAGLAKLTGPTGLTGLTKLTGLTGLAGLARLTGRTGSHRAHRARWAHQAHRAHCSPSSPGHPDQGCGGPAAWLGNRSWVHACFSASET